MGQILRSGVERGDVRVGGWTVLDLISPLFRFPWDLVPFLVPR